MRLKRSNRFACSANRLVNVLALKDRPKDSAFWCVEWQGPRNSPDRLAFDSCSEMNALLAVGASALRPIWSKTV